MLHLLRVIDLARRAALTAALLALAIPGIASVPLARAADQDHLNPVFSQPVVHFDAIKPIADKISAPVVRAKFTQTKSIAGLSRPIVSSGNFLYAKDRGVYWNATEPFDMTYLVTSKGVTRREDGQIDVQLRADDHPAIRGFSTIFLALFSGDLRSIEKSFDLHLSGDAQRWTIGLKATDTDVSNFISAIVIAGDDTVREVELREANGDTTVIKFSGILKVPVTLSAEEEKKFES